MAQNKRYYWLKLHEEFFNQPVMKYIRKLPEGEKIMIIYLKLLLVSLRNDGYIYLEGLYPTVEEEIALNLNEELMSVKFSLAALEKVNLLERGQEDWNICMTRLPEMIGVDSFCDSTRRVREYREKKKLLQLQSRQEIPELTGNVSDALHCNPDETPVKNNGNTEIEKQEHIEIEPEQKKEEMLLRNKTYGINQNVFLSDAEYRSLCRQFPDYLDRIDYLSSYMASTGKHYDSHYLTICQWAKRDAQKISAAIVKEKAFRTIPSRKEKAFNGCYECA